MNMMQLSFIQYKTGSKKNENFNSISQTLSGEPAALNDDNFVVNTNDSDGIPFVQSLFHNHLYFNQLIFM